MTSDFGIVLIGRNEGPRLDACLRSLTMLRNASPIAIIYVDSGSTDNSLQLARAAGAEVVTLDTSDGFTAARARNAGARRLLERAPNVAFIQFLDGDCILDSRWPSHALEYMSHHSDVAVVCGRRRERFPTASVFNTLCDIEWNTPIGNASEFGGDCLMRAEVFATLNGYRESLIAGEEPDFAARMRLAGHRIVRLNHEMTLHDAAMTSIIQWWRRTRRSGHALAELYHLHGKSPLAFYKQQVRSTLLWGLIVPLGILFLTLVISWWCLLLFPLAYTYLAMRISNHMKARGEDTEDALAYGLFCTVGKFPQLLGLLQFHYNRRRNRRSTLIEYKGPSAAPTPAYEPASATLTTSKA